MTKWIVVQNNVDQALKIAKAKGYSNEYALGFIASEFFYIADDKEVANLLTALESLPDKSDSINV